MFLRICFRQLILQFSKIVFSFCLVSFLGSQEQISDDYFVNLLRQWLRPCLPANGIITDTARFSQCLNSLPRVQKAYDGLNFREFSLSLNNNFFIAHLENNQEILLFRFNYGDFCKVSTDVDGSVDINDRLASAYCAGFNYLRQKVLGAFSELDLESVEPQARIIFLLQHEVVGRELRDLIFDALDSSNPADQYELVPKNDSLYLMSRASKEGELDELSDGTDVLNSLKKIRRPLYVFNFSRVNPFRSVSEVIDYVYRSSMLDNHILVYFPLPLAGFVGLNPRVRFLSYDLVIGALTEEFNRLRNLTGGPVTVDNLLLSTSFELSNFVYNFLGGNAQATSFRGCPNGYTNPANVSEPKVITPCNNQIMEFAGFNIGDLSEFIRGEEWGSFKSLAKILGYNNIVVVNRSQGYGSFDNWHQVLAEATSKEQALAQRDFFRNPTGVFELISADAALMRKSSILILKVHGMPLGLFEFVLPQDSTGRSQNQEQIGLSEVVKRKLEFLIWRALRGCYGWARPSGRGSQNLPIMGCSTLPHEEIFKFILCEASDYQTLNQLHPLGSGSTWNDKVCRDWIKSLPERHRAELISILAGYRGVLIETQTVAGFGDTGLLTKGGFRVVANINSDHFYEIPRDLTFVSACGNNRSIRGSNEFQNDLGHSVAWVAHNFLHTWPTPKYYTRSYYIHAFYFANLLSFDLAGRVFFLSDKFLYFFHRNLGKVAIGSYTADPFFGSTADCPYRWGDWFLNFEKDISHWRKASSVVGSNLGRSGDRIFQYEHSFKAYNDLNCIPWNPGKPFGIAGSGLVFDSSGWRHDYPDGPMFNYSLKSVQDSLDVRDSHDYLAVGSLTRGIHIIPVDPATARTDYSLAIRGNGILKHLGFIEAGNTQIKVELAPRVRVVDFNPSGKSLRIGFTSNVIIGRDDVRFLVSHPQLVMLRGDENSNFLDELVSSISYSHESRELTINFKNNVSFLSKSEWEKSPVYLQQKYGAFKDFENRSRPYTHYDWPYFLQVHIRGRNSLGIPLVGNHVTEGIFGRFVNKDFSGYRTFFIWQAPLFSSIDNIRALFQNNWDYVSVYLQRIPPYLIDLGVVSGWNHYPRSVLFSGPKKGVPEELIIRLPLVPSRAACLQELRNVCTTKTGGTGPGGCVCDPTTDENCEECSFRLCEAKVQDVKCEEIDYIKCELAGGACCDRPRGCRDTEPCEIVEFFESQEEKEQFKADCESSGKYFVPRECRWLGPYGRCCGDPVLRLAGMECSPEVSGGCCPPPAEGSNPPGGGDSPDDDPSQCAGYWWYDQYVEEGEVRRCPEVNIPCEEDDDNQQNQQNQCNEQNGNGSGAKNNKQNDKGGGGTSATSGGTGSSANTGSQGSGNSGNQGSGGSSGTTNLKARLGSANAEDCPIIIQGEFKRINRLRDKSPDIRKELRRKELKRKWTNRIRLGRDARDPRIRSRVRPILRYLAVPTCHWPGLGSSE